MERNAESVRFDVMKSVERERHPKNCCVTLSLSVFETENNNMLQRKFRFLLPHFWLSLLLWGLLAYDSIILVYCISVEKGQDCRTTILAIFHCYKIPILREFRSIGFLTEMIISNQLSLVALLMINLCIRYKNVSLLLLPSTQKKFTMLHTLTSWNPLLYEYKI